MMTQSQMSQRWQCREERITQLLASLDQRILVLDGAMGTWIQDQHLSAHDFGGPPHEGCHEALNLTRPDLIQTLHERYLQAGCDIIETNTFGGTPLVLVEYELGERVHAINQQAAEMARLLADQYSTPDKPRFVAGSMGPTTKSISVTGGISFPELQDHFYLQAKALEQGGVDFFLLETCQDTRNIKAGICAIERLFAEQGHRMPIAVSVTIEPSGTLLAGQTLEAVWVSLSHLDLLYLGLNCSAGPAEMTPWLQILAQKSHFRIACVPNAGLPDETGGYPETPEHFSSFFKTWIQNRWVNFIGGCCGTQIEHIQRLAQLAQHAPPRIWNPPLQSSSFLSGLNVFEMDTKIRPILVGERTNVIGSKRFKTFISEKKFEEAVELGRIQIKKGAQLLDICLSNSDGNEWEDMQDFLKNATQKIFVPLLIDSMDPRVIELALTYCQGKSLINSINLEDGEEKFQKIIPLAQKYGAALVVGLIDNDPVQGMGITRTRKMEIAEKSYSLLVQKYQVPAEDIYWDPLVFPCVTANTKDYSVAQETIEAIALLKKRFPLTKVILGISNISFGLPQKGRAILNSVFLNHCVRTGLDLAIVNSENVEAYDVIPAHEKKLAENVLFNYIQSHQSISEFNLYFKEKSPHLHKPASPLQTSSDPTCLSQAIIEGSKEGLIHHLNLILEKMSPLEIMNGPLMQGMEEVGKRFNAHQLIVSEVLQSAEVMKAAMTHLEPFLKRSETLAQTKMILATVKGDVHDIGKNLVDMIFTNNGFKIINLGLRVPASHLVQAIHAHQPQLVGLSGLLVKSAHEMVQVAKTFEQEGLCIPLLVGGAALSEKFVDQWIAPAYPTGTVCYASDVMSGLSLAKRIIDPLSFSVLKTELTQKRHLATQSFKPVQHSAIPSFERSLQVPLLQSLPKAPDWDRHVIENISIEKIWNYLNPLMLYSRHLGIKGSVVRSWLKNKHPQNDLSADTPYPHSSHSSPDSLEKQNEWNQKNLKPIEILETVDLIKKAYQNTEILKPRALYQFFKAAGMKNSILIFNSNHTLKDKEPLSQFDFLRQDKIHGLCLSDYVAPLHEGLPQDSVAFFVVTVGKGVSPLALKWKAEGEYLKSHILQAMALELAEAYAELLHTHLRTAWGFSDPQKMTMLDRFQSRYRGKRYSFGYSACPRLEDQALLWKLLDPTTIDVQLTDGCMMDPEASISALVLHHPQTTYFSVGLPL